MAQHLVPVETPFTCPPMMPNSRSNHDLSKLTRYNSRTKNKGSRYYHHERLMQQNRAREYHQAEQAFEREQYDEAARICHEILDDETEDRIPEGIMARANMLLARPELKGDAACREHSALEAIRWWTKIIMHHAEGHQSGTVIYPVQKVYSKYPAYLAEWCCEQAHELLADALTDQDDESYLGPALGSNTPMDLSE
ncbi:hypothetical protein DOTSEDRAFT_81854 [Dothistroma septosporum NZE10]|uniref:Uncharacterized protein n=1 Tax=Dothistroma septosporum (strain NZE10 / CBS 128990) TaxID=675120 RepID=N1PGT1_DOTSN|nr:hypothetical protein DOTSEDRAFT_81854 [Dothistroma septosporum NZE10]